VSGSPILRVAELDLHVAPREWAFARDRADDIRAHLAESRAKQPSLFNGRVLLLGEHAFETRADGALALRGSYFETDFADFLAWRDFGFPDAAVCNGFSMAALQSIDGAFLLGEMGAHTANAGAIYFAAGTPDRQDVFGDRMDLTASVTRELEEETGIRATETRYGPDWIVVHAPPRVACMKIMRLAITADAAKARIDAFLAQDHQPELAGMHIVRDMDDVDVARTPDFVVDFLRYAFG
jgi:8-oxo-dGTP pyrophosphatase MutT (NUDIX family)